MNIYELFEKIQAEKPEIFAMGYNNELRLVSTNEFIKDSLSYHSLDSLQLYQVPMEWLMQLDIFAGVEKIHIVHGPSFMIDPISGLPTKDSPTFLGGTVKSAYVEPYQLTVGDTIPEISGKSIALYSLDVVETDLQCTPEVISEMVKNIRPGAVLCKTSDKERVLIVKYNIEKVAEFARTYPQVEGEQLIDKIVSNVGNVASKLIKSDVSNIGRARSAKARLLILPPPHEYRTEAVSIKEWGNVHEGEKEPEQP